MRQLLSVSATSILKLCGWKIEGQKSEHKKEILIAAPHTSNWDYIWMVLAAAHYQFPLSWIGKKELFNGWVANKFMRATGGIPVDRSKSNNMVKKVADQIHAMDEIHLCVPPEGTRKYRSGWKSGFYYMALEAGIPITFSFVDYGAKTVGIGPSFLPSGNIEEDMEKIALFYEGRKGKFPEKQAPIVLLKSKKEQKTAAPDPVVPAEKKTEVFERQF